MSADHQLAEALARVEHKLDILLAQERKRSPMLMIPAVGDFGHTCPLCHQQVKYIVDPIIQILIRKCGCKTGLQAPINLEAFAPPATGGRSHGRTEEQHDDPDPDGGHRRKPSAGGR